MSKILSKTLKMKISAQLSFRLGLTANTMFLIGAANFVAFSALELNNQARSAAAHATYIISFIFFSFSGFLELTIDSILTHRGHVRTHNHARYTRKTKLNIVISVIFIIGSILDLVAFTLWQERDFTTEHHVLFASAHIWLLSAILSLCGQYTEIDRHDISELFDGIGNILFFVGAMIDCIVRYMDDDSAFAEESVSQLEFSSSFMWLANALCFVAADVIRLKRLTTTTNTTTRMNENHDMIIDECECEDDKGDVKQFKEHRSDSFNDAS